MEDIKVNLHGHFLPGFDAYWRDRTGIKDRNLAEALAEKCLEKELGIYAITDDCVPNRFETILTYARQFSEKSQYRLNAFGPNSFMLSYHGRNPEFSNRKTIFLRGQEIEANLAGRKVEVVSFGCDKIEDRMELDNLIEYCDGKTHLTIPHATACSIGGVGKEKLEELCNKDKILAVEHNPHLTLPSFPWKYLPKFSDFTIENNYNAMNTAWNLGVPIIANDDSNMPEHVGVAYTIFNTRDLDFDCEANLVKSLINNIKHKNFNAEKGYIGTNEFFRWAIWELQVREHILGMKKKWERKHL